METAKMPTTDKWIKEMWYLHTMEFCSAIKKNEILSFAGKWMELESIILSEVTQVKNAKIHMFSLILEYGPNTNTSNITKNRSC
jgi:hypothetical protein